MLKIVKVRDDKSGGGELVFLKKRYYNKEVRANRI